MVKLGSKSNTTSFQITYSVLLHFSVRLHAHCFKTKPWEIKHEIDTSNTFEAGRPIVMQTKTETN